MSDNTTLNAGSGGDTIASDDVGGVKYQRVKPSIGADGAAADVHAGNPMPMRIGDGTNQVTTLFDVDSGAGSQHVQGVSLRKAASGGSVEAGTAADPLRVDPTGATTQPVSAASLPLPSGAAQEHTAANSPHATRLSDGSAFYKATTPADTQPVSAASLPLPTGAATESTLSALNTKVATAKTADFDSGGGTDTVQMIGLALPKSGGAVAGGTSSDPIRVDPTGTTTQPVSDGGGSLTVDGSVSISGAVDTELPAAAALADGAANPITPTVGAALLHYNGSTFDRVRGDTTNGIDVDVTRVQGTVNVGDGGGSITVDAPVGTPVNVQIGDGTRTATVRDTGASDALNVAIVDASGNHVTSFGGGAQFAEDTAHTTGDLGTQVLAVRKDVGAAIAGTDGDYSPLQVDASGNLRVNIAAGGGGGGTSATDEATYTPASSSGTPIMGAADETTPDAAAEGTLAIIRSTLNRALHVNLRDASGNEISPGAGTQYDEDTASVAAEKLTMAGVVRSDAATSKVDTDGDRTVLLVDANGRLHTNGSGVTQPVSAAALPLPTGASTLAEQQTQTTALQLLDDVVATDGSAAGTKGYQVCGTDGTNAQILSTNASGHVNIADGGNSITVDGSVTVSGTVTANAGTGTHDVAGVDAHDAAITGKPVLLGAKASAAAPADVSADDDAVKVWALRSGALVTQVTAAGALIGGDATNGLDVDVTRVPAPLSTSGGGTEASALRVTIANDSTGVVSVDDNGGSLTVDGTVTVTQSTASSLKAQVQGEAAHDAAVAGNPVAIAARANTSEPGTAVADGDATHLWADKWGRLVVVQDAAPKTASADAHGPYTENQTASGDQTIIAAPGASTSIVVTGFWLSNNGTSKIRVALTEGAAGTARYRGTLAADGGGVVRDRICWVLPANTALVMNLGAAGDVDISVDYHVQATP